MKIFFFSTVFSPSVGGIERLAEMLCREFAALGHEVRLATLTPGDGPDAFPYPVERRPSLGRFLALLRWCDVHVQANVSLKYAFARFLRPRRVVYQHNNVYQRDDGSLAPVDHLKRGLARHTPGIAVSRYTAAKLRCRHTIANAYDDSLFRTTTPWHARAGDLVFLGRLVSQKGADVLLRALGRLAAEGTAPRLTVIGDGDDRQALERLAAEQGVADRVHFAGRLQGQALADELNRHRVLVVPSRYEEPFGLVALEGLACGCLPVVSVEGGLVDAIGPHGYTVPNGDDAGLAATLRTILTDPATARHRLDGAERHLEAHTARSVAARYLAVFEGLAA